MSGKCVGSNVHMMRPSPGDDEAAAQQLVQQQQQQQQQFGLPGGVHGSYFLAGTEDLTVLVQRQHAVRQDALPRTV